MDCICDKFVMVEDGEVFDMSQAAKGDPGPGVAPGGTTGQILAKASDDDFDTEWIDQPEMDAEHVSYDSTETYSDGTVGKELGTINSALTSLQSVTEIIDTASGAIASFPDGAGLPMRSLLATIEPKQDLHGYDAPYPAGGGANKIVATVAGLKSANTSGLWSGDTYTANNVTFEVLTDDGGNITGIKANGTASGTIVFYASNNMAGVFAQGALLRLDGITGGSSTTYKLDWQIIKQDSSSAVIVTTYSGSNNVTISEAAQNATASYIRIVVYSGAVLSNQMFYPMIKLQSDVSTAFVPSSNECPITGWTGLSGERDGKNLLAFTPGTTKTNNGVTYTANNDYTVTISGTATATSFGLESARIKLKAGTYTLSASNATGVRTVAVVGATTPFIDGNSSTQFTLTSETEVYVYCRVSNGTTVNTTPLIQIELGSTATTYEPYTPLPITCTWQTEAGTVYDGYIDVVSGELVATHLNVDMGSLSYSYDSTNAFFSVTPSGIKTPLASIAEVICSTYKVNAGISDSAMATADTGIYLVLSNGKHKIKDTRYTTASAIQTALTGQSLCYPLATPQTYQLTPQQILTLLGNNTVFVDTGAVSVTYQASIKGYIDKVLAS